MCASVYVCESGRGGGEPKSTSAKCSLSDGRWFVPLLNVCRSSLPFWMRHILSIKTYFLTFKRKCVVITIYMMAINNIVVVSYVFNSYIAMGYVCMLSVSFTEKRIESYEIDGWSNMENYVCGLR